MVRAATPWQTAWTEELQATASFDDFDLLVDRLTQELSAETAARRSLNQENAPPAHRTSAPNLNTTTRGARSRDTRHRYDPAAASGIQKLYRANRSKAMREILDGPSPYCTNPSEHLYSYFKDVFNGIAQNDAQCPECLCPLPRVDAAGVLETDFTPKEAISHDLLEKGYKQDMQQCHAKIKELRQAYQKAREANHHSVPALKTCCFYKELDAILGSNPASTATSPVDTSVGLEAVDLTPRTKSWMRRSIWRMMWSTQQGCLVAQQVRNCFPHQRGLASPSSLSLTRIMQERRALVSDLLELMLLGYMR
ncbi:hypothetical protein UY3_14217 [Chelonia mydas]|uniref:Myb/SANT-like DNA-binding domain-containing protein n=1 Tax=Chelonia mydas TaxID=8469 RepID=M7AZV1_CHEMY|nr:hypothetical protein UY3_14217 [Chelonia mydas]